MAMMKFETCSWTVNYSDINNLCRWSTENSQGICCYWAIL